MPWGGASRVTPGPGAKPRVTFAPFRATTRLNVLAPPKARLSVEIVYDLICPWCYLGVRRLLRTFRRRPDLLFDLSWRPLLLNPDMPRAGMGIRPDYVIRKLERRGPRQTLPLRLDHRTGRCQAVEAVRQACVRPGWCRTRWRGACRTNMWVTSLSLRCSGRGRDGARLDFHRRWYCNAMGIRMKLLGSLTMRNIVCQLLLRGVATGLLGFPGQTPGMRRGCQPRLRGVQRRDQDC